jgi:hypothetical protein
MPLDCSVTPPTAPKRAVAARPARPATAAAAASVTGRLHSLRSIGADRLAHAPGERARPVGVTHLVDGWQPVCGGARIRFVFPGATLADAAEVCDDCAGAAIVAKTPRQRRASTG